GRLPLYLWSRQSLREKAQTDRPINFIVAAALAGSAPFAGFPARILLLRAATAMYWPLALVLAMSFLLWLPGSLRLGRTIGAPKGRQLIGLALDPELVARPGLLLVIQSCWLLSVLGPAIEPESLRPQVLGNVLVPALLPVKVASGFLYLLCVPALMRLWPMSPPAERRARPRF